MPTDLTREFLQQVVRGSGWSLAEVESLSLEKESISSLGGSFAGATRLVYLNLARNHLSSLLGVEHLASLATLILRENRVEAMDEVGRLAGLSNLRDLDLRLNPIMTTAATGRSNFAAVGESGGNLSGSASGRHDGSRASGASGSDRESRRGDLLRALPQLASLNGERVVDDDERLPRGRRPYQQNHRQKKPESPHRQRDSRQHHAGRQHRQPQERQRRPRGSAATSARPPAESVTARTERTNDEDSSSTSWNAGLGTSNRGGLSRRRDFSDSLPSEAAAEVATTAPGRTRRRGQPLPRRAPVPPHAGGGDGDDDDDGQAGEDEDEFSRFFPSTRGAPIVPPPSTHGERGAAPLPAGGGDAPPLVFRSGVSPGPRDCVRTSSERYDGGYGTASENRGDRDGDRCRRYGGSRALETEAAARRGKRDRPGAGDVSRTSCRLDGGKLSGLHLDDRRGGALGGDSVRASAGNDCLREPRRPVAGVGRGAAAVLQGGQVVDPGGRAITPPQAAVLASPTVGEDGHGDDLAKIWLELGTHESVDSRRLSLPPSLSSSVAAATTTTTTTTTTVSAASRAVQAFRRSTQRLGLPATVSADGVISGAGVIACDNQHADSPGRPSSPGGLSSVLGEPSLPTAPLETSTAAKATTTLALAKRTASSERATTPDPKPGSEFPKNDGNTQRCTACGGTGAYVERRPYGPGCTAGNSEASEAGRASFSARDAREMDERWWAREREFTERWAAREREFDARWATREREFDGRRREESKEFTAEMRSMLLGAHEALISSNAWLVDRLKTVEASAKAAQPSPGRPPSTATSRGSSNLGKAVCHGPTEIGATALLVESKQSASYRVAAVDGTHLVSWAAPGPGNADRSTAAAASETAPGAEPSGDEERRREGGDDRRVRGASQADEVPPRGVEGCRREDGKTGRLAKVQAMQSTGVMFDAEVAAVVAASNRSSRVVPPSGCEARLEGEGEVGVAPVAGVVQASRSPCCGHDVAAPWDNPCGEASPPGRTSEHVASAADSGSGATGVTPLHVEDADDSTGGDSGGDGMVRSSQEDGVFGGDPEVTVAASSGV